MRSGIGRATLWCLPVLAVLVAVAFWNPVGDFWKSVEPPKAQCEAYRPDRTKPPPPLADDAYDGVRLNRLIREPQNTVSNLAYIVAGLALLISGRKPATGGLGLAAIFLGFGSGVYHASLLPEWRLIDILGVYAVLYLLLLVGAGALSSRIANGPVAWMLVVATWLAAIYTGIHRNDVRVAGFKLFDSTYVFVAAVAVGCVLMLLAARRATNRRALGRALGFFATTAAISFTGGLGDRFGSFWANPDGWVQGHAVWHTFGAIALLGAYEAFVRVEFDRSVID